jgi:N6-adenosine-specific RNA methylase IME4
MTWPFDPLQQGRYRVIYADPPWKFSSGPSRNPRNHYPTMSLKDIAALPVNQLAHPDGCRLFMWTTMPLLHKVPEILKAWGFRYSTARVWGKLWSSEDEMFIYADSLARGTGYEVVNNCELLIIAKRGKPEQLVANKPASLFFARRREHSRKPEKTRDEIANLFEGPRCELFARSSAPGWEAWGNETTKFDEVAA